MTQYLGDIEEDSTIDFMWSSNDGAGGSVDRATNGQVRVYKGNGTVETTIGVTDDEAFDGLLGVHHTRIVTTNVFYAIANDYTVVLQGAVIDGETVNAVLAHFSIENRLTRLIPAIKTKTDALPSDPASETNVNANETKIDAIKAETVLILAGTTNLPTDPASETNVDANETKIDAIKAETVLILADTTNLPSDPASETNVNANETKIDAIKAETVLILADTTNLPPDPASETNVDANEVKIDAIKAETVLILADTTNLPPDPASETNVDANETKIDAIKAETVLILADTNEMQGKLPDNNIMGSNVKTDKDDEIDDIQAKINDGVFGLAAIKTGVDSNGVDINSIQTNTRFTTAIPTHFLIPDSGNTVFKLTANLYDTSGNMEDPDSDELAIKVEDTGGTSKNSFFDDSGASTPATAAPSFAGHLKMVKVSTGVYETFLKILSSESTGEWTFTFVFKEATITITRTRGAMVLLENPGSTTLANNASNKEVIARAVRDFDSDTVIGSTPSTGSIEKGIRDKTDNLPSDPASETNVDANETKIDAIKAETVLILADTTNLPSDPASETNVDANETKIDAIKAETALILADTTNLPSDPASETNVNANETKIDAIKAETVLILADTTNLPPDPASETNVDANEVKIDAIKAETVLILEDTTNLPADPASETNVDANEVKIDAIKAETALILADTTRVDALIEDVSGDRFTNKALEQAPSGTMQDELDRLLGLTGENVFHDTFVYDTVGFVVSERIRTYSVQASVGSVNDVLATYTVASTRNGVGKITSIKITKDP